ncbi:MAG: hypothetical protein QM529_00425 [Hydrotalea sp.]|nr:hypothetical protein [Hydrotalea sp.]
MGIKTKKSSFTTIAAIGLFGMLAGLATRTAPAMAADDNDTAITLPTGKNIDFRWVDISDDYTDDYNSASQKQPIAVNNARANVPFTVIEPTVTFGMLGIGVGGGISIGLDSGDKTDAGNIDFHYLSVTNEKLNQFITAVKDAYGLTSLGHVPAAASFTMLNIPVTYDWTAKFGGNLKLLVGSGVGLDLFIFYPKVDTGVGAANDAISKLNIPIIPEFLLTPRVGVEWTIDDGLAIGLDARAFVDLPAYQLSRIAVDGLVKFIF